MRLCVFGNKDLTARLIEFLHGRGVVVTALVTLPVQSKSVASISGFDDGLTRLAGQEGISVYEACAYSLKDQADFQYFKANRFDVGLCLGWQRLIPSEILNTFEHGVFGWHGSGFRFPNGRGRSPLNWSIRLGLNVVYHNCFRYDAGADAGCIFETEVIDIGKSDYISDLQLKVFSHICRSSLRLLSCIERDVLTLSNQPDYPFIWFPKLDEKSGHLQLSCIDRSSAINIVRSCSRPFPGAYIQATDDETKIRVWRLIEVDSEGGLPDIREQGIAIHGGKLYVRFANDLAMSEDFEILSGVYSSDLKFY